MSDEIDRIVKETVRESFNAGIEAAISIVRTSKLLDGASHPQDAILIALETLRRK